MKAKSNNLGGLQLSYKEASYHTFAAKMRDGTIVPAMKPKGKEEQMANLVIEKLKDALAAIDQKLESALAEFKQGIHSERPAQHSPSGLAAPPLSQSTSRGSDTNSGRDRYSQPERSSTSSESDLNSGPDRYSQSHVVQTSITVHTIIHHQGHLSFMQLPVSHIEITVQTANHLESRAIQGRSTASFTTKAICLSCDFQ
jgi:hypothetical protein